MKGRIKGRIESISRFFSEKFHQCLNLFQLTFVRIVLMVFPWPWYGLTNVPQHFVTASCPVATRDKANQKTWWHFHVTIAEHSYTQPISWTNHTLGSAVTVARHDFVRQSPFVGEKTYIPSQGERLSTHSQRSVPPSAHGKNAEALRRMV